MTARKKKLTEGVKNDQKKPRWDLLPWAPTEEVVRVLTFGARKYEDNNWQRVSPTRIFGAAMRHIVAWVCGEKLDPETGRHHLAHAICNLLFLIWHDKAAKKGSGK